VVCNHDIVRAFTVTEVVVGDDYDCHRIVAPAAIDAAVGTMIHDMALQIGRRLDMQGIFDIELIMYKGIPHVLEIDARFPSQTPIAIYHATGLNLFEETARVFLEQRVPGHPPARKAGCSILQHVRVNPRADGSTVEPIGECQLRYAGPFTPTLRFAGVESMLESTGEDGMRYVTLIASGTSHETVDETMRRALRALAEDEDERLAADMEPLY
jgi:pyrrolysine biosynthesis protein PylC